MADASVSVAPVAPVVAKKPKRVYKLNEFTYIAIPDGMEVNSFEFQKIIANTKRAQAVSTQIEISAEDLEGEGEEVEEVESCPEHPDDADLDHTDNEAESEDEPDEKDKAFIAPEEEIESSEEEPEETVQRVMDLLDDVSADSDSEYEADDVVPDGEGCPGVKTDSEAELSEEEEEEKPVRPVRKARAKADPKIAVGAKLLNVRLPRSRAKNGKKPSGLTKAGPKADKTGEDAEVEAAAADARAAAPPPALLQQLALQREQSSAGLGPGLEQQDADMTQSEASGDAPQARTVVDLVSTPQATVDPAGLGTQSEDLAGLTQA